MTSIYTVSMLQLNKKIMINCLKDIHIIYKLNLYDLSLLSKVTQQQQQQLQVNDSIDYSYTKDISMVHYQNITKISLSYIKDIILHHNYVHLNHNMQLQIDETLIILLLVSNTLSIPLDIQLLFYQCLKHILLISKELNHKSSILPYIINISKHKYDDKDIQYEINEMLAIIRLIIQTRSNKSIRSNQIF